MKWNNSTCLSEKGHKCISYIQLHNPHTAAEPHSKWRYIIDDGTTKNFDLSKRLLQYDTSGLNLFNMIVLK